MSLRGIIRCSINKKGWILERWMIGFRIQDMLRWFTDTELTWSFLETHFLLNLISLQLPWNANAAERYCRGGFIPTNQPQGIGFGVYVYLSSQVPLFSEWKLEDCWDCLTTSLLAGVMITLEYPRTGLPLITALGHKIQEAASGRTSTGGRMQVNRWLLGR